MKLCLKNCEQNDIPRDANCQINLNLLFLHFWEKALNTGNSDIIYRERKTKWLKTTSARPYHLGYMWELHL